MQGDRIPWIIATLPDMDDPVHRRRITACLTRMGFDSTSWGYEVLPGGISGVATYRVRVANEYLILKIVEATHPRDVRERAAREILFYRNLTDRIPVHVPAACF